MFAVTSNGRRIGDYPKVNHAIRHMFKYDTSCIAPQGHAGRLMFSKNKGYNYVWGWFTRAGTSTWRVLNRQDEDWRR